MTSNFTSPASYLRIDKRNHVEKPHLDQLHGLRWKIIYNERKFVA